MNLEFLPLNFRQTLYSSFKHCHKVKGVWMSTLNFYKLEASNQLNEIEDQRVARYLHRLRNSIQDALAVHTFYNISEAQSKAKVLEQQQTRTRNLVPRNTYSLNRIQPKTPFNSNPPLIKPNNNSSFAQYRTPPSLTNPTNPQQQNNRKANIRCHRCHDLGYYANECLKARVQYVAEQDENFEKNDDLYEDGVYEANPDEVFGEILVMRRLCLAPSIKESWKRHVIFKTH